MKIGFNVTPLQTGHSTRGIGSYTRNLLNELQRKDVEIVEFIDPRELKDVDLIFYPWFDLYFRTLKIGDIPTIVMVHDVMPLIFSKAYPPGIKGKINFLFQKRQLQKAKFIITNSDTSKNDISQYLGIDKNKIEAIPLAPGNEFRVLSEQQNKKTKERYHLPDCFMLYVGDANYVKNLPFLIKGFKEIKEKKTINDLKLVLVGGAFLNRDTNHPELASLMEVNQLIIENHLENDIIRPGQVSVGDLVSFYNLASLYIQPSLYEGFGIPVLEAMKCGCPVLSSNSGSLKQVGGESALYFDPGDLRDLGDKIDRVLKDEKIRKELIAKGLKRAEEFSWEKTAERTFNVFKKI